jgi:hypothetical protein
MYCLRSLGSRDRGFESHSRHGCLVFVYVCAFFCVCVQVDELITRPRSPTDCLWFGKKPKWNGKFHGDRPRPTGAVVPMKKKIVNDTDGLFSLRLYIRRYIVSYRDGAHITKRQKVKFISAKSYLQQRNPCKSRQKIQKHVEIMQ